MALQSNRPRNVLKIKYSALMRYAILCFSLFSALSLSAQYDRGQGYFSGSTAGAWQRTEYSFPNNPGGPNFGTPEDIRSLDFRSFRAGYFPLDRLLIGAQLDYLNLFNDANSFSNDMGRLLLNPFARYYFLAGTERRVNLFGELGFGTVGIGDADGFETDFHLGAGAEVQLSPGILGTANLNYNANAWGLNFTTLDLGLNVLTGQLADWGTLDPTAAGTLTARGSLGSVSYGRMKRGEAVDSDFTFRLAPSVGYFVARGLHVELGTDLLINRQLDEIGGGVPELSDRSTLAAEIDLDVRYYPLTRGRLLPYLTAGIGRFLQRRVFTAPQGRFQQDDTSGVWRAGAGFSYFYSPHLALDVAVRYERGEEVFTNLDIFNRRTLNFNRVGLAAGLRFFLPRG
jgi:opacity protein-like surface antigen